mgnify:CR=1
MAWRRLQKRNLWRAGKRTLNEVDLERARNLVVAVRSLKVIWQSAHQNRGKTIPIRPFKQHSPLKSLLVGSTAAAKVSALFSFLICLHQPLQRSGLVNDSMDRV